MSWSDKWAYSMTPGTMTNRSFEGFTNNLADTTQGIPGVGIVTNEVNDVVGDGQDAWGDGGSGWQQFTNAVEVVTPAFVEDVGTNGMFNNNNPPQAPVVSDPTYPHPMDRPDDMPPVTPVPSTGQPPSGMWGIDIPDPLPTNGLCPEGFMPNPDPVARSTRSGPNCVPMNTTSAGATAGTTPGFDEYCEPIPKEYPPPTGCIPSTTAAESTFFRTQREGCQKEWKTLERMEEEVKARYEQLCMAREKFNQRRARYGDLCGPYELLYGISEEKEKDALAKAKAQKDCLNNKSSGTGGGCGCTHKSSSGCGCGCSGNATSTPSASGMEFEYVDPLKTACKRSVDESFKETASKKTRVTPARAAKSGCMPCMLKQPKVYRTTTLRKPAKTVAPTKKTARAKTVRKVAPKAKRSCR